MPLSVAEAKRSLNLLWEVKEAALEEGRDTSAVNRAISMLHSYVTEIQPSTQLSVWDHYRWGAADGLRTTHSSAFGPLRVVELICSAAEKLGIYLDSVSAFSKDVHSSHGFPPVVISLVKPLSTAERSGELAIGDQVLEINGHSLAQVSLQKARWLLESAYRSGKVTLVVVSSGLVSGLKRSHTALSSPFGALENLSTLASTAPSAKLPHRMDNRSMHSSTSSLHHRPTYTPSLGSRGSDHNLLATTVELAAHLGMKKPLFKKRKVVKLHVMKGPEGSGLALFGGKHSKAGDIGIFIREIKEGSWALRDGRLKVGDELLVVNGKSLIGLTLKDATEVIAMATNPLQLVIATEKSDESARSSYNRDSGASFSFMEREGREARSQGGTTAASIQPAAYGQQGSPSLSWGGLSFPGTPQLGTYPKESLFMERTASLGQASMLSSNLPRVISDSSLVSDFSSDYRPSPVVTPVKAPKRGARRKSEADTPKRSKLAMFFKREKRPKKVVSVAKPTTDKAEEKQKLAHRLSDDISIGEELYPMSPVERDHPVPEDQQEERDLVGDLDLHQQAWLKGASKQRPSVASTASYASIQSQPPEDLAIVTNWARLSSASSLPEAGSATPRLGVVKTVLLYKPPKSQHKPLGFTLHGGKGSHFGDVGIHIKFIAPDSLADADSRLLEGDELLEVNSQPVEGLTHRRVAQLIKGEYAKFGMISLKVQTSEGPLSPRRPIRSPSVKGTPFQVVLQKEPGASLGIEFTGLTFDDNHFGIYIQSIAEGSCASLNKKLQRGDQILSVNGSNLVETQMDQVHSLFGSLPYGDVVLKLMRPSNVTAVHRILHSIASTKRRSREGNFMVEVFGQAEADAALRTGRSPIPEPRPENAPNVDPEILKLLENDGESPVFQEREVKPRELRPSSSYVIDTSRHSRVDDSDLSSSEEESEPVRDLSPPERDLPAAVSLTHLPGERRHKEAPAEGGAAGSVHAPPISRLSSASFSTYDVISKGGMRNNLQDMQALFTSAGTSGDYTGKELRGLSRNFSALSGTSTVSFITETVSIHKGPDGFGMTILGGQDTPLHGALVTAVEKDGPAFLEGGIERGDEVLEVNGQSILGLNHSEVISVLRSISGVAHLIIARSAPEHMQSLVTSQNSLAKSDKTDSSLPPPAGTRIQLVPSFGKEDGYGRGTMPDHSDDDGSSSTGVGRDEVGMKSKSYSSEAVLDSTDDELADHPTIIRETVASMASGTVATLDGRRLRPPLTDEQATAEWSMSRGDREEGSVALEGATPVILTASSSGTSLNEVGRPEVQPSVLPLQLRRTPPSGHKSSRPVSKASSGMSIVVSYAVDWHEEQEENRPPSLLDERINEVLMATREGEPGHLAANSAVQDMKVESKLQGDSQNSVKSGKEGGEGEEEEVDEHGIPVRFERVTISLQKKPRTGLGITVVSSGGPTSGYHQIRRILPRSLADRDGQLRPGDRLLSMNGKSLHGLTHAAVLDELKTNAKECALEILRDPLYDVDATSSVYSLGSGSYGGSLSVLSVTSDEGPEGSGTQHHSAHALPAVVDQKRVQPLRNYDPEVRKSALPSLLSRRVGNLATIQQDRPASMPEPLEEYSFFRKASDTVSPLAVESVTSSAPVEAALQESETSAALDQYEEPPPSGPPPTPPVEEPPLITSSPPDDDDDSHPGEDHKVLLPLPVREQVDHPSALPPEVGPHRASPAESDQQPRTSAAAGRAAREVETEELPRERVNRGPFLVEVTKGFFSLGLTAGEDSTGAVVVKALQSRSPFSKSLKVGDWLLSVNKHTPKSATHANEIIKSLPRGPVHVVAMAPPSNVTSVSEGAGPLPLTKPAPLPPPRRESLPQAPPVPPPLRPEAPPPLRPEAPPPQPTGEQPLLSGGEPVSTAEEEEKVIEVEINRQGRPLGITIQGGSDMPQQYVYIHSIQTGSPADVCRSLRPGDQLIMCGNECLVGLTWKEAQGVVNAAPERLTIVAQRKQQSTSSLDLRPSGGAVMKKSLTSSSINSFCSNSTDAMDQPRVLTRNSSEELLPPIPGSPLPDADIPLDYSVPDIKYSSCTSSAADLEDFDGHSLTVEEQAVRSARDGEEVYAVELYKNQGEALGFVIAGGDNITPDIYVKKIVADSVSGRDGRLKKGDRVMFVDECNLAGMTKTQATDVLRSTGHLVQLIIARRPLLTGSATGTPMDSLPASQGGSRDNSPPPTPKPRQSPSAGTLRRRHRRSDSVTSIQSGRHKLSDSVGSLHSITEDILDASTTSLPRDIGPRQGVKLVELVKGPTGLGMKIVGGKDQPKPFIVRDVFPGGSAAKSGQIFKNDQILEVNGRSFDNLTHREAIEYLKTVPPGKVQMLLRSAEFVKVS